MKNKFFFFTFVILLFSVFAGIIFSTAGCGGGGAVGIPSVGPTAVPTNITFPTISGPGKTFYRVIKGSANGRVEGSAISGSLNVSAAAPFILNLDGEGNGLTEVNQGEYMVAMYEQNGTSPISERQVILTEQPYTDDYSGTPPTVPPTPQDTPGPGTPTWTPSPTATPTATLPPGVTPTETPVPTSTFTPTPTATATAVPSPVVTLIAPLGGPEGTEVTIVGSNLGSCSVKINGTNQSSGFITQNDGMISFNIVSGTYVFGQGFTTIEIESTGGNVSDDFVVYQYRSDISKDATGWGLEDLVFNQTGSKIFGADSSYDLIRDISFPGLTENNSSGTLFGGPQYISFHPGNNTIYVPQGTTAAHLPLDLSSITYFSGAPFSGQANGVAHNPVIANKIFFVNDGGGSSSNIIEFDTNGSNPSSKINLSSRPDDMGTDSDGNFFVISSDDSNITKYNSAGTYSTDWSQLHGSYLCCKTINGKTAVFASGSTGTGNPMYSLFLVDGSQSTRMCDIVLTAGWGPKGGDFNNNYLVFFVDPPRRFEVFSF